MNNQYSAVSKLIMTSVMFILYMLLGCRAMADVNQNTSIESVGVNLNQDRNESNIFSSHIGFGLTSDANSLSPHPKREIRNEITQTIVGVDQNTMILSADGLTNVTQYKQPYNPNHTITSGQTWQGISDTISNGHLTIVAKANRKGSTDVAHWFKTFSSENTGKSGVYEPLVPLGSSVTSPGKLNFSFIGDITLHDPLKNAGDQDFIIPAVVFGQGHNSDDRNNWWAAFSPKYCQQTNSGNSNKMAVLCTVQGQTDPTIKRTFCFTGCGNNSGDENHFWYMDMTDDNNPAADCWIKCE